MSVNTQQWLTMYVYSLVNKQSEQLLRLHNTVHNLRYLCVLVPCDAQKRVFRDVDFRNWTNAFVASCWSTKCWRNPAITCHEGLRELGYTTSSTYLYIKCSACRETLRRSWFCRNVVTCKEVNCWMYESLSRLFLLRFLREYLFKFKLYTCSLSDKLSTRICMYATELMSHIYIDNHNEVTVCLLYFIYVCMYACMYVNCDSFVFMFVL